MYIVWKWDGNDMISKNAAGEKPCNQWVRREYYDNKGKSSHSKGVMALDDFFDEILSALLVLLLMTLKKDENDKIDEKPEDKLEVGVPEVVLKTEPISYICKSSNRKRLRPKAVYF